MSRQWREHCSRTLTALGRGLNVLEATLVPHAARTRSDVGKQQSVAAVAASDVAAGVALAGYFLPHETRVTSSRLSPRALATEALAKGSQFDDSMTKAHAEEAKALLARLTSLASEPLHVQERRVMNAVAQRLGLPPRFHWHDLPNAIPQNHHPTSPQHAPQQAAARSFLWAPAVRTAAGPRALPDSSSNALGLLSSPEALFAFTPSSSAADATGTSRPASVSRRTSARGGSDLSALPQRASSPLTLATASAAASPAHTTLGGGILHSTAFESYLCVLHTAKTQGLSRASTSSGAGSKSSSTQHMQRLSVYCSDQTDPAFLQAARFVGFTHIRVMQTVLVNDPVDAASRGSVRTGPMYRLSVSELKRKVVEDLGAGRFPCLVVGVLGSTLSASIDPLRAIAQFCHKTGVWLHIEARGAGTLLLSSSSSSTPCASSAPPPPEAARGEAEDDAAWAALRHALLTDFTEAAALADSIQLSTPGVADAGGFSLLPGIGTVRTPSERSLLFLSHVGKLRWALHALDTSRQGGMNTVVPIFMRSASEAEGCMADNFSDRDGKDTSGGSDGMASPPLSVVTMDAAAPLYLRLVHNDNGSEQSPREDAVAIAQATLALAYQMSTNGTAPHVFPSSQEVRHHQRRHLELQARLQGDGRFDCGLPSAPLFGKVYVRFLTQSDEATTALAHLIARQVASQGSGVAAQHLTLSLALLQRRVWLVVSLTPDASVAAVEEEKTDAETSSRESEGREKAMALWAAELIQTCATEVLAAPQHH